MHSHVEEAKEIYDDYHAKLNQTGTKKEPDFRVMITLVIHLKISTPYIIKPTGTRRLVSTLLQFLH